MAVGIEIKHLYLAIIACNLVFLIASLMMLVILQFYPDTFWYSPISYTNTRQDLLIAPACLITFSAVAILISRIIPIKNPEIKKSAQGVILYSLVLIVAVFCVTFGDFIVVNAILLICAGLGILGIIVCTNKDLDSDDKKWRRWNYGLGLIALSVLLLILKLFVIPNEHIYPALFLMMIIYEIEIVTYEIKID